MKKQLFTFLSFVAALALLATACGGSDSGGASASAEDQEVIDAVTAALSDGGDFDDGTVDVPCVSSAMVIGLGGAAAIEEKYGMTAASIAAGDELTDVELPRDEAFGIADNMMECGLANAMVGAMTDDGMSEDQATCLMDNLDQEPIRDIMAAEMMAEDEADVVGEAAEDKLFPSMLESMLACDINPDEMGL